LSQVNDGARCYACEANTLAVDGVTRLSDLPPHTVVEEGINVIGQHYHRLLYTDLSEDLLETMSP
jgi:hypothetical protein